MKHTYVGKSPTTLADGQPVAFGDEVDLNKTQARANAHLIDAGVLVPAAQPEAKSGEKQSNPENRKEGDDA